MNTNLKHLRNCGGLDKYYTKTEIAGDLVKQLHHFLLDQNLLEAFEQIVEPSAGNGAFLSPLDVLGKPVLALDIAPENQRVEKADFLQFQGAKPTLFLGNPPFGHVGHKAVRFFNHSANCGAEIIAFVLPRSFRKQSVQNRLNRNFHLCIDHEMPKNAFLLRGQQHHVPTVFQIWRRFEFERKVQLAKTSQWIEFTTADRADYAIRRVGRRAGDVLEGLDHNPSTTLFFRTFHQNVLEILRNNETIRQIADDTAGVRSISKAEIGGVVDAGMTTSHVLARTCGRGLFCGVDNEGYAK